LKLGSIGSPCPACYNKLEAKLTASEKCLRSSAFFSQKVKLYLSTADCYSRENQKRRALMLHLILGRSGSGKTQYIRSLLRDLAKQGARDMILLVPEQFSFESERSMLELLGPRDAQRVEILSFSRLVDAVFRVYGGVSGTHIDDGGRMLLMSLALEAAQEHLDIYFKHRESPALAAKLLDLVAECRQCAVTPAELQAAADKLPDSVLRRKSRELALILDLYDTLVARSFIDDQDDLTRLNDTLLDHPFFHGRIVAIDAFKSFTVQEQRILSRILAQAQEVYLTLCTDTLADTQSGMGLFSPVQRTARRVISLAKQQNVPVAAPVILAEQRRFRSKALGYLEQTVFHPEAGPFPDETEDLFLCTAQDKAAQCDFVARTAKRLIREEGLRCRDMAIIARDADAYREEMTAALRRYGVPAFEDSRQPIDSQPLIAFVRAGMEAAQSFGTEPVLRYLKTGLTDFALEEISELENYMIEWNISGSRLLSAFTQHPEGYGNVFQEQDRQKLACLNGLRERATQPLVHLRDACQGVDGAQIAHAAYAFLEETNAAKHLRAFAQSLSSAGEEALALEQGRIWDLLMALLSQCAIALEGHPMPLSRFAQLFDAVLSSQEIGTIPQGLDEIPLGSADRMRASSPRIVFLLGANEGEFPRTPASSGVFSDAERRRLIELGLEMTDPYDQQAVEERLLAYQSLSAARERLYVCHTRSNGEGGSQTGSVIVSELNRLFPHCIRFDADEEDALARVEGESPAFLLTASRWGKSDPLSAALKRYFASRPDYAGRLAGVGRAACHTPARFENPENSRRLFGDQLYLSASRVEVYHKCRFQYFCRYGLNARPRKIAKLDPLSSGTVVHDVLERLLREHSPRALHEMGPKKRAEEIEALLLSYLEEKMGGAQEKPKRFSYQFARLSVVLEEVVGRLCAEFLHSSFEPIDFELRIDKDGLVAPYSLPLPDGGTLQIKGSIDRVDRMERDGKAYLRVVDYKSGGKEFLLSDVLNGLNMQMLIYLMCLWQNGAQRYGEVVPAGILYMPVKSTPATLGRNATQAEIDKARAKACRMSGMVLDHSLVIDGMEDDGKGIFIPVRREKDGGVKGTLINLTQLSRLQKKMDGILTEMGESLHRGEIGAVPSFGAGYDRVCDWCDYKSVCGYEPGAPVRPIEKLTHAQSLECLEKEETRHG
jgi:ATP-dependent helicase/nuclease subunit B